MTNVDQSNLIAKQKTINDEQKIQIESLQGRLNLLLRESILEKKKVKIMKHQAVKAYSTKKLHDDYQDQEKLRHQQESIAILKLQQLNSMRALEKNLQIEQIRQASNSMKHQEYMRVENESTKHRQLIADQKQLYQVERTQKKYLILGEEEQSKLRIQKFFQAKNKEFEKGHTLTRSILVTNSDTNRQMIQILEKEEIQMLQNLQKSQLLSSQASQQLMDARKMSHIEYSQFYLQTKHSKQTLTPTIASPQSSKRTHSSCVLLK